MSQLFSTDLLPVSDRVDAWQWNAKQICGDCLIQLPRSSLRGTIDVRDLGELRLTRFASSPLAFSKWPCDTVRPENRFCIVITQISGARNYQQKGSSVLLIPGDSTLIDSGSPWSSTCNTDCDRLYLRMPRWLMESRLRRNDLPFAQRISGNDRMGAALHSLCLALYDEAGAMKKEESDAALDAYFEVLAECIGGSGTPVARSAELCRQIQHYIDAHLAESSLGPAEIASAVGVSVRHLHRLFLITGNTLGSSIRLRRLERCRRDLQNPGMRDKTITEIAFQWGFSDSAHFSHAFRRHFGVSPRAMRLETSVEQQ